MSNLRITAHTNEGPSSVNSTPEAPATCTPIPGTPETPEASKVPGAVKPSGGNGNTSPEVTSTSTNTLLAGYLYEGYYKGEGKNRYPAPALVDYAAEIGKSLAAGGVTVTAFNRLLRTLKTAKNMPFEAQIGALKKVVPQVIDLENQKKAPPLLREVAERHREKVQNEADFSACLDHFRDIAIFLKAEQK